MRERVFLDEQKSELFRQFWHYSHTNTYAYDVNVPLIVSRSKVAMLDIETPMFKRKSAAGEIINSPMAWYNLSYRVCPVWLHGSGVYTPGIVETHGTAYDVRPLLKLDHMIDHTWDTLTDYVDELCQRELDIAVTKAWSRVDVSKLQSLASLGEMPETIRWIRDVLVRVVKLLKLFLSPAYKREAIKRLLKKGINPADVASNLWLEWRYAIRPLIFEMQNALEALKTTIDHSIRYTARGGIIEEMENESVIKDFRFVTGAVLDLSYSEKVRIQTRAGVMYQLTVDIPDWAAIIGLDAPISSAYELIQFSFIWDWFWNIGSIIASFEKKLSVSPLASWSTAIITRERKWEYNPYDPGSAWSYNVSGPELKPFEGLPLGATVVEQIKCRRPSPPRSLLPRLNIRLNAAKIIDLIAIGRGLLANRK